jgi:hypothetical protein
MFIEDFNPAKASTGAVTNSDGATTKDRSITDRKWRLPIYFARVQFYFSAELLNNLQGG